VGEKQKQVHQVIIVVDTNIVFSGILNPQGTISDLLLNSNGTFDFYAPTSITDELYEHHQKLLGLSGLTEYELDVLLRTIMKKIGLIDLETLPQTTWQKAVKLAENVDEFDTPFIALSIELGSPLWTGDKKLANGLRAKGVDWILGTEKIKEIRDKEGLPTMREK
jgi:predicted nucleic acid-binding protein